MGFRTFIISIKLFFLRHLKVETDGDYQCRTWEIFIPVHVIITFRQTYERNPKKGINYDGRFNS